MDQLQRFRRQAQVDYAGIILTALISWLVGKVLDKIVTKRNVHRVYQCLRLYSSSVIDGVVIIGLSVLLCLSVPALIVSALAGKLMQEVSDRTGRWYLDDAYLPPRGPPFSLGIYVGPGAYDRRSFRVSRFWADLLLSSPITVFILSLILISPSIWTFHWFPYMAGILILSQLCQAGSRSTYNRSISTLY